MNSSKEHSREVVNYKSRHDMVMYQRKPSKSEEETSFCPIDFKTWTFSYCHCVANVNLAFAIGQALKGILSHLHLYAICSLFMLILQMRKLRS